MTELVRVYVGSDERGGRGEAIIRYGLQKYASCPIEMIVMEPNTSAPQYWGGDWNRGRDHMRPYAGGHRTNFTVFRFTIPEAAGYSGRAIYVDADITIHGDIWELYSFPLGGAPCSIRKGVILFDCEHPFWRSEAWPKIEKMRPSGWGLRDYLRVINKNNDELALFPIEWDVLDGNEMDPYEAKLNHYTGMGRQPYHPFPDRFAYPRQHPVVNCDGLWWTSYLELRSAEAGVPYSGGLSLNRTIRQALELESAARLNGFGRPVGYKYHFTDLTQMHREAAVKNPHGYRYDLSTLPRSNPLMDSLRVVNPRHLGAKLMRRLTGSSRGKLKAVRVDTRLP
jgi:hypothetical protein